MNLNILEPEFETAGPARQGVPMPQPMQLAKVTTLGPLQAAMPAIEAHVERKLKALDNRLRSALIQGELSPAVAQQAWLERFALQDLLKGLDSTQEAAKSVGERLKSFLDR